jgi:hypothetical protein
MADLLETARQWTIIDADLFQSIPFSSFQISSIPAGNTCEDLQPRGVALWTLPRISDGAPELRRFIDHFNAESLWATAEVLHL